MRRIIRGLKWTNVGSGDSDGLAKYIPRDNVCMSPYTDKSDLL
jgi:hypothetical protein